MSSIAASSGTEAPAEEFRWGWPVVLACFFTATFAWGFGFYGNSVYVAVLHDTRGWSLSLITGATTLCTIWPARYCSCTCTAPLRFWALSSY